MPACRVPAARHGCAITADGSDPSPASLPLACACRSRAWVRDLGAAWAEMDLDGDGKVSAADLRRYFGRVQPGLLAFLPSIFRAIESRSFASGRSASARPGSRGAGGSGGAGGGGGGGGGAITFQQFLKALYPEASLSDLRTLQAMAADRKSRAVAAAEAVANDKLLAEIQVGGWVGGYWQGALTNSAGRATGSESAAGFRTNAQRHLDMRPRQPAEAGAV